MRRTLEILAEAQVPKKKTGLWEKLLKQIREAVKKSHQAVDKLTRVK